MKERLKGETIKEWLKRTSKKDIQWRKDAEKRRFRHLNK